MAVSRAEIDREFAALIVRLIRQGASLDDLGGALAGALVDMRADGFRCSKKYPEAS